MTTLIEFLDDIPNKTSKNILLAILFYNKKNHARSEMSVAEIKDDALNKGRARRLRSLNFSSTLSGAGSLVNRVDMGGKSYWHLTDKGEKYISDLLGIPLPQVKLKVKTPAKKVKSAVKKDASSGKAKAKTKNKPKVFIIHGHDDAVKVSVARFLEKMGFDAKILHELPNQGRTIIQKFDDESKSVSFAIGLLTPDDVGGKNEGSLKPRARQNVIFELGYFRGLLGAGKVLAIVKDKVETPSDYDGILYTPYDSGSAWQLALCKELKAAGFEVDMNLLGNK